MGQSCTASLVQNVDMFARVVNVPDRVPLDGGRLAQIDIIVLFGRGDGEC